MLRFAADENFNGDIVRGLLRRNPQLDVVRVQDAGLSGADDPSVLEWAADQGRIVISMTSRPLQDTPSIASAPVVRCPGSSLCGLSRRLAERSTIWCCSRSAATRASGRGGSVFATLDQSSDPILQELADLPSP